MKRFGLILPLLALSSEGLAQNAQMGAAERALGNAQIFNEYSLERADEILAPDVHTSLPQSGMNPDTLHSEGVSVAGDADTYLGRTYDNLSEHDDRSYFGPNDDPLSVSDSATIDPESIITTRFSTTGGQCEVTTFTQAPKFTRTCDALREAINTTCRTVPIVDVIFTMRQPCTTYDINASGDQGYSCVPRLWPGASCTTSGGFMDCVSDKNPRAYVRPYWASDVNGNRQDSSFSEQTVYTYSTSCEHDVDLTYCSNTTNRCVVPGGDIMHENFPVYVPCREYVSEPTCPGGSYFDDCDLFESDSSCVLESDVCFSEDADGLCGAYERTYSCGDSRGGGIDASCEDINVCVAGVCNSVEPEPNVEIPIALAHIGMLNALAAGWNKEDLFFSTCLQGADVDAGIDPECFDESVLKYFAGDQNTCRKGFLGTYNCCRDSGWALGIFTECRENELTLIAAQEAFRTVYTHTRCSTKLLFICIEKKKYYCQFGGRFAREVSYQGQRQLYGRFECRGLTHEEFAQLNFDEIDLSPVFGDLIAQMEPVDVESLEQRIRDNVDAQRPQILTFD